MFMCVHVWVCVPVASVYTFERTHVVHASLHVIFVVLVCVCKYECVRVCVCLCIVHFAYGFERA